MSQYESKTVRAANVIRAEESLNGPGLMAIEEFMKRCEGAGVVIKPHLITQTLRKVTLELKDGDKSISSAPLNGLCDGTWAFLGAEDHTIFLPGHGPRATTKTAFLAYGETCTEYAALAAGKHEKTGVTIITVEDNRIEAMEPVLGADAIEGTRTKIINAIYRTVLTPMVLAQKHEIAAKNEQLAIFTLFREQAAELDRFKSEKILDLEQKLRALESGVLVTA